MPVSEPLLKVQVWIEAGKRLKQRGRERERKGDKQIDCDNSDMMSGWLVAAAAMAAIQFGELAKFRFDPSDRIQYMLIDTIFPIRFTHMCVWVWIWEEQLAGLIQQRDNKRKEKKRSETKQNPWWYSDKYSLTQANTHTHTHTDKRTPDTYPVITSASCASCQCVAIAMRYPPPTADILLLELRANCRRKREREMAIIESVAPSIVLGRAVFFLLFVAAYHWSLRIIGRWVSVVALYRWSLCVVGIVSSDLGKKIKKFVRHSLWFEYLSRPFD